MRPKAVGGPEFYLISYPQLEIHVLWKPGSLLLGPPPAGACMSQCAGKGPQNPQLLQRTLSGQGLRSAMEMDESVGRCVPGVRGPHSVPCCGGGSGAVPTLRHILYPVRMSLHSAQAHVFPLLKPSIWSTVRPNVTAKAAQITLF
jgi:hypothetical protein